MKEATEGTSVKPDEGATGDVATSESSLAAWEIASVTSSFLIAEWMVMPFAGNSKLVAAVPVGLAFTLMLLSHHARRESAREIGWRFDNFGSAARLLVLPMLVVAIVLVGIGLMTRSLRFDRQQVLEWAVWLPLWGLMQQYVLQGFINRRAQILYGRGSKSVLLVALIFALLHLPNPWLSVATFAGGLVWAYVYQRAPNLIALALSHALMSMLLALSLPPATINSLRVGIKYFG
ncbi:MAG TPA: CPBP family intramembrane glutamic endopeptidase [Pyrinomonadaceae bacterium]|jgi:membrane protease YdiL (CAAX protease family)|nr:CPBP family intramembrane glutamic endopeptidase [Pyrinomonadaceae bacterium]